MVYDRKQAAVYLGCSVSKLNKLACHEPDVLPYTRIGKLARYKQTDLDKYERSQTKGVR